jgi:uncharacterized protein (TIGR02246 family)
MAFRSMIFAIVAASAGAGCQTMSSSAQSDPALARHLDAWTEASNACNVEALVSLYDPQALMWPTTSRALAANRESIRQYFDRLCAGPRITFTPDPVTIRRFGDVAVSAGSGMVAAKRPDGAPVQLSTRYTSTSRWDGTNWRIIEFHSSFMPAMQAPQSSGARAQ